MVNDDREMQARLRAAVRWAKAHHARVTVDARGTLLTTWPESTPASVIDAWLAILGVSPGTRGSL